MLTTHSEWVLDELANLVHLSNLSESDREGIGGAELRANSPDEVGVWVVRVLRSVPRGRQVREIPFSGEYGGFASDFERSGDGHVQRLRGDIEPDRIPTLDVTSLVASV